MARDVIMTAYACSSQAPCSKWGRELFADEPIIISVPGSGGTFLKKGRQWAATGDAFRAALQELAPQHKDVEIRRRAIITFSAGWLLPHHILISPKEQQLLDACIMEDGLHTKDLDHWVNFATRAVKSDAWMVMAHSQIVPPFASAKETNESIFHQAIRRDDADPNSPKTKIDALPEFLGSPSVPAEGIRITVSAVKDANGKVVMPAQTKVWRKDCLSTWDNRGNLYLLEYEGNDRPDHVYIAFHVQPRLWKLLAAHWGPRTSPLTMPPPP
jgi:hypothetical protein